MKWGVPTLLAALIALGLVLKFGKTSNTLMYNFWQGTKGWMDTLTLSNLKGNTP